MFEKTAQKSSVAELLLEKLFPPNVKYQLL